MKSWLCCIGLVAVAVFTGAACGDDSSPTGSGGSGGTGATGGAGGSGGSGGSGATDAGGTGGGASKTERCSTVYDADKIDFMGTKSPVYTCTEGKSTRYPDGPNACRNQSDCDMINTPPSGIRQVVKECALSCLDKEPSGGETEAERMAKCAVADECNTTCVRGATSMKFKPPGISDACGKCYSAVAHCSIAFCLMECSIDADAIDCIKCQFANGCRVPFERCSGIDRQE